MLKLSAIGILLACGSAQAATQTVDCGRLLDVKTGAWREKVSIVVEDGSIDEEAISAAIDTLIEAKPYLAAGVQAPTPGDPDAGSRKAAPQKDLPTQIREAEAAGDYTLATRLKTSQLLSS